MSGEWARIADEATHAGLLAAAAERLAARRAAVQGWGEPVPAKGELWRHERAALTVWVSPEPAGALLLAVDGPGPGGGAGIRSLLAGLGRAAGWSGRWRFGALAGDAVTAVLAAEPDAHHVATKMQLAVGAAMPAEGVRLQPMDEADYAAYRAHADEEYAQERFASGADPTIEAARETAAAQLAEQLPDGPRTTGQRLWTVRDADDARAGIVWIAAREGYGFINDISIDPSRRGQGLGTGALRAAADAMRAEGLPVLALNVFGGNDGAGRLYAREGYRVTETLWTLPL